MSRVGQGYHCPGHGLSCRQHAWICLLPSPVLNLCHGLMGFFQLAGLEQVSSLTMGLGACPGGVWYLVLCLADPPTTTVLSQL